MDKIKDNSKKWIIGFACAAPLVLMADFFIFSSIMGLLREKSDMALLFGVIFLCAAGFLNYLLVQLIINKTKTK